MTNPNATLKYPMNLKYPQTSGNQPYPSFVVHPTARHPTLKYKHTSFNHTVNALKF